MRILKIVVVVLVVLVGGVYAYGSTLPRDHVASSRIALKAAPDSVFAVLRAFGDYPKWDTDFKSSVKGESRNGNEVWVQDAGGMTMSVELTEIRPPSRIVSKIVTDESSSWGGVWTYAVEPAAQGSIVTITEDGWIKAPIFRVMMKAMGTHATMDGVLTHLAAHFGEQVKPEHLK